MSLSIATSQAPEDFVLFKAQPYLLAINAELLRLACQSLQDLRGLKVPQWRCCNDVSNLEPSFTVHKNVMLVGVVAKKLDQRLGKLDLDVV